MVAARVHRVFAAVAARAESAGLSASADLVQIRCKKGHLPVVAALVAPAEIAAPGWGIVASESFVAAFVALSPRVEVGASGRRRKMLAGKAVQSPGCLEPY